MRVFTHDKKIVKVKHLEFSWAGYALLLNIQQMCPNMLIEIEGNGSVEEFHKFIPALQLDLEVFQSLSLLNA